MRSKKAIINMLAAIGSELVTIVCGLILPRLILGAFGSSYNGITSSITQFLSCVALLRAGVSGVTRAALYKPLAENDSIAISGIINATERFMRRVALIFVAFLVAFACLYPMLVSYEFEWMFAFSLALILGISTFIQYYFGMTYQMLLQADQKQYVVSVSETCATALNTIIAVILIKSGMGIHAVKLGSAFAFSLTPLVLNIYVKKHYQIDKKVDPNQNSIKQRWDAFWQSVAFFVHENTDVIVLTCFADIKEVSVYTVYNYVIANIRNVIRTFVTGFGSAFGNMLAKKEYDLARKNLEIYELIIFNLTAVIYTTAGIMIVPFVLTYTKGVYDVSYGRPLYAFVATVAGAFSCFRIPYQTIVEAAGHFKQTKNGAFIEAGLNITISVIAVIKFGLIGVALGTLVATVFRSIQYSSYLSKNILPRSQWLFWKHILVNGAIAICVFALTRKIVVFDVATNYFQWALQSTIVVLISALATVITDILFYKECFIGLVEKLLNVVKQKKGANL